jgi:hypothetical protein
MFVTPFTEIVCLGKGKTNNIFISCGFEILKFSLEGGVSKKIRVSLTFLIFNLKKIKKAKIY